MNLHLSFKQVFLQFLLVCCCSVVMAQSSGSGISGFIYEESDNKPLEAATILVKNTSTGFTTSTISNKQGYFSFRELPVGVYNIEISAVGFQPTVMKDNNLNLGDRLVLHKITLSKSATTLTEVTVQSTSFRNSIDRLGTGTAVSSRALQKIPVATRNYTDLMMLSPLANGASLAGAKPGGTGYMLDGVSNRRAHFAGTTDAAFSISSETIREFEISTNSYDVTNGRGSGGVVKAITKSGTNTLSGSAWGYYGANSLAQTKDVNGKKLTTKYEVGQFGALLSGPIIKDKIHFLVSYDQYTNTIPFAAYDFDHSGATPLDAEKALKISRDSLKKIINIMETQYGFPGSESSEYGSINIKQETKNAFAKFDWIINKKNLLTLKYNYLHFVDPNKLKSNGLLSTQYTGVEIDNAVMLGLRTEFSSRLVNELKLNFSTYRKFLHFLNNHVPEGFVNVKSKLSDGTNVSRTVAFGDQNWVPERDASDVIQIVDYLRWKTGKLNFTFGTDNNINHVTDRLSHDQQGQFYYNSIQDMVNNTPYRFNRKIPLNGINPKISVPIIELGLFAQMETNLRPNLNLTVGLRWDGQIIGSPPTYNALLEHDLGINNHVVPFDAKNIQPRVNLIWDVNNDGRDIVKWGAGLFASELTTQPITFSHIDNGVDFRQVNITSNVPIPDWKGYQKDFNLVPGVAYYNSLPTTQPATVLVLDKHLKNPLTFKTSLSYYHYFNSWFRMGANVYFDNTWDNFYLYDLNLKRSPEFVTPEGREVYVKAANIDPASTNQADIKYSRISSNFNQVRYFTNTKWSSKYIGAVIEAAAQIGRDGSFTVSYAKGKATGTPPYDNGDPRNSNFAVGASYWNYSSYGKNWYSDGDQPNKIVALLLSPTFYGFSISSSFQAYQNARYSAYIDKDVIGEGNDGQDLAYIYDPNNPSTPASIATGMNTLLQNTSPEYRKFLQSNFGKFAPYLGGIMPWRTQWNMSVAYELKLPKTTHKISFRCDIFNVLNLLNYKWGGYTQIINTNPYSLAGFDQTTNSYKYTVNTSAGQRQKNAAYYSVQFGARYSF
jgi:hypothetical protein